MVSLLYKVIWLCLKKLKIRIPYDSAVLLLGIYAKELKAGY